MSISRRFLLASSFARLLQKDRGGLRHLEGYFREGEGRSSYVLLDGTKGSLVLRKLAPEGFIEERAELPRAHAEALFDVTAGEVDYVRTKLLLGACEICIDQFIRPSHLHLVSVTFGTEANASNFYPPSWFGPEITGDVRYHNQLLALHGPFDPPEVPISDVALNSLLDALENHYAGAQPLARPAINKVGSEMTGDTKRAKRTTASDAISDVSAARPRPEKANLDAVQAALLREMAQSLQGSRRH